MQFQTTAVYVSGAICGETWMPQRLGGFPFRADFRREISRMGAGATFRDVLLLILSENGGDFQSAEFAADTVLRIERRTRCDNGAYRVHVREREISQLPNCADLVNEGAYSGDFFGGDD